MTAKPPNPNPKIGTGRTGRRRFLARLGAAGLGVAVATFARPGTAYAATCGCCSLANCPPNTTWSYCVAHMAYSWRCYYSSGGFPWQCECCETSGNVKSAYACWPR